MPESEPRKFYLNGRFLTQRVTGVQRYGREILSELDCILAEEHASHATWTIVAPRGAEFPQLRRISCAHSGRLSGHAWEQLELPWIARDGFLVSFGSTGPLFRRRQVITVHDASVYRIPEAFSWRFRFWYRVLISQIVGRAPRTMVVSAFAAEEAQRYFGAEMARLDIVQEGWQHMQRLPTDDSILRAHDLSRHGYVLAVSSPTPNKNFALVADAMRELGNLPLRLVVAGEVDRRVFAAAEPATDAQRLTRVGYVSDAQLKALYENAFCFVFPSKYEGFGIPALEAMALGCPVVASRIAATIEVCRDAARYFDPDSSRDLADVLRRLYASDAEIAKMRAAGLARASTFSWRGGAERVLSAILASSYAAA
jgi:glycosyltransferase involved in cell wall biosynthesis